MIIYYNLHIRTKLYTIKLTNISFHDYTKQCNVSFLNKSIFVTSHGVYSIISLSYLTSSLKVINFYEF